MYVENTNTIIAIPIISYVLVISAFSECIAQKFWKLCGLFNEDSENWNLEYKNCVKTHGS